MMHDNTSCIDHENKELISFPDILVPVVCTHITVCMCVYMCESKLSSYDTESNDIYICMYVHM